MSSGESPKSEIEKLKEEKEQVTKWFESAMMMVDNTPVGLLWCNRDDDFAITYANDESKENLKSVERFLPCRADAVVGGRLDVLFATSGQHPPDLKNPETLPYHKKIPLGEEVLNVQIKAIFDKDKDYCGAMVAWRIVTREVKLADTFEAEIKGVVETMTGSATELQATAQVMAEVAARANEKSTAVASAADGASGNVQTVASAAEELSSSIDEISRQVAHSSSIAGGAVQEAEHVNGTVQNLAEAATKIGEVVELINDIAGQTNLLALNATIEAARAGDAGKGFAVVANEVKSLANQTAKATEDIASQIGAIQSATKDAVGAIQGIGKTISQINEIATAIASAVEEQGAATSEIARNIQGAAEGTEEVSSNIAGVTEAANEAGQAAGEVLTAASDLSKQSEALRGQVEAFLTTIRVA